MRRIILGALTIFVISCAGFALRWFDPWSPRASVDTMQYARMAYEDAGFARPEAYALARSLRCDAWEKVSPPPSWYQPTQAVSATMVRAECPGGRRGANALSRYEAIFESRPALPSLVAALIPQLGVGAFAAVVAMLGIASGVFLGTGLLLAGYTLPAAATATAWLYVLPSGFYISQISPEGGATLGLCAAMIGFVVTASRSRWGLALIAMGAVVAFLFKPVNGVAVAVSVAVAALILSRFCARRAALMSAAVLAIALAGGMVAATSAFGWPGLSETMQDTLTRHFTLPPVGDPWTALFRDDVHLVRAVLRPSLWAIGAWGATLSAGVLLVRKAPASAVFWAATAASAVAIVLLHPVQSETSRLLMPLWVALAAGLALVAKRGVVQESFPMASAPRRPFSPLQRRTPADTP